MNVDKRDASDAMMMRDEGYLNLKGVASTMIHMLDNAVKLNNKFLGDDEAVGWIRKELAVIIDERVVGNEHPYPYTLRPQVFTATKNLHEMAFTSERRNAPMSYPPLTVATKCLALSTSHDSYYNRPGNNEREIVPHIIVVDGFMLRKSDWITVTVNDETYRANLYQDAVDECREALVVEVE